MEDMALLTLLLAYREQGINKFLNEMRKTIRANHDIVPMIRMLLNVYNIIDSKRDKGILLEFIQEYLNILKTKNMEE